MHSNPHYFITPQKLFFRVVKPGLADASET